MPSYLINLAFEFSFYSGLYTEIFGGSEGSVKVMHKSNSKITNEIAPNHDNLELIIVHFIDTGCILIAK